MQDEKLKKPFIFIVERERERDMEIISKEGVPKVPLRTNIRSNA